MGEQRAPDAQTALMQIRADGGADWREEERQDSAV